MANNIRFLPKAVVTRLPFSRYIRSTSNIVRSTKYLASRENTKNRRGSRQTGRGKKRRRTFSAAASWCLRRRKGSGESIVVPPVCRVGGREEKNIRAKWWERYKREGQAEIKMEEEFDKPMQRRGCRSEKSLEERERETEWESERGEKKGRRC